MASEPDPNSSVRQGLGYRTVAGPDISQRTAWKNAIAGESLRRRPRRQRQTHLSIGTREILLNSRTIRKLIFRNRSDQYREGR